MMLLTSLTLVAGEAHITFSLIAPLSSGLIRANRVQDCPPCPSAELDAASECQ